MSMTFYINNQLIKRVYNDSFHEPITIELPNPILAHTIKFQEVVSKYSIWESNTLRKFSTSDVENLFSH